MRLYVRTLTGKTIIVDLADDPSRILIPDRFKTRGAKGISQAKIQGGKPSVVVKAASKELADFWKSKDGQAVREFLQQRPHHFQRSSLDELLIEFSRFFVLKAIFSDTAPPRVASEAEPPSKRARHAAPSARLSPSREVDEVWHALMMFPQVYQALCQSLASEMICHDPRSKDAFQPERYHFTFKMCLGRKFACYGWVQGFGFRFQGQHAAWGREQEVELSLVWGFEMSCRCGRYIKTFGKAPPASLWPLPAAWYQDPELCEAVEAEDLDQETVASLKARIQEQEGTPPCQQRLILGGKQLLEDQTLAECGVADGATLHLVLRLGGC